MRFLNPTLTTALVLSVAATLPAMAGKKDSVEAVTLSAGTGATQPDGLVSNPAGIDPTVRFVESNVTETLYHELAHALIDIMSLPVFGPEELAADLFAVILMNRLNDEAAATRLAYDVAHAYQADGHNIEAANQQHAAWDKHGSNRQRYFNLACLFYGADPDGRDDLAQELGLPDARAASCEEEFAMANTSWGAVLDDLGQGAPGASITMDWILDSESHLTRFISGEVGRLNGLLALPEPIVVSVIPCGEVNAFYDPAVREIIICTELSDHLAELAP